MGSIYVSMEDPYSTICYNAILHTRQGCRSVYELTKDTPYFVLMNKIGVSYVIILKKNTCVINP